MKKLAKSWTVCIILGAVLQACAGLEADLEKARYLLGRGGTANAEEAVKILEPLVQPGQLSGSEKIEAFRLYAGAKMAAAGFNSTEIITSLLYTTDSKLLGSIKGSGSSVTDTAKDDLDTAADRLNTLTLDADFAAATALEKQGIYFQIGMVDFLRGLRVYLKVSGLGSDGSFNLQSCKDAFAPVLGNLTNPNSPTYGLARFQDSQATFIATTKANLDAQNKLIKNLSNLISDLTPLVNDAQQVCDYLNGQ